MTSMYTETPDNYTEISPFIETDIKTISSAIIAAKKVLFYDTCSFRAHSNLSAERMSILADYYNSKGSIVVITRCILMELASTGKSINTEYINYLRVLHSAGIKVILLDEESLFDILSMCFSTNSIINEYLMWAVRLNHPPASRITYTLANNKKLYREVIEGKNLNESGIYKRFFSEVRANKEHSDNLGEELICICTYILSYLPGINDGKLCIITDDKEAAGKIDNMMKKIKPEYKGAKVLLFSTPKLVQYMYQDYVELSEEDMTEIISAGNSGNVVVMGTTPYDLKVNPKISMTAKDLVNKIIEPNGINIVF